MMVIGDGLHKGIVGNYLAEAWITLIPIKDGYVLLQSEVFMRITNNREGAEKHINRIKPFIPDTGTVRIMRLTEKQFCNMGLYQAEEDYQESIVGTKDYIML